MKHINTYSIALSMLASLLFAGCVKEEWTEDRRIPGDRRISFSVGETYAERTGTRTAYSGVTQQTDGTAFRIGEQPAERIDWVDGDRICIWSDQATYGSADRHYGDYLIKTHTTQEALSSATVTALGGELTWGEGYHHFFAVYPSPSVVDPQGDGTQTLADNGRLVIPDVGAEDDIWQFRAYIPSTQTLTWEGNVGVPDMTYAYMCASLDGVTPNENSTVTLYFKPAVSAFRFTIDGTDETPQQLSSFQLKSEYGPIAGNYNVRMGGTTEQDALPYWSMGFECPSSYDDEENSDTITVDLTGKSVSASSSITFTVFTFPETGNLTIVLNFADGKSKSLDLKYGDGSWVPFPACSKSNLTSLKAPSLEKGIPDFRFSVSDTKQVYFSSGNLQYQVGAGDGPDATTANGTWYFAPQEWVPIGYPNEANIAAIAAGTAPEGTRIDLFAFGTSGKEYGAIEYLPWQMLSASGEGVETAYGIQKVDYVFSGDGDWGTHPIENAKLPVDVYLGGGGYDAAPLVKQGWYTLDDANSAYSEGWEYLMGGRKNAEKLFGVGRVWDEAAGRYYNGAILLPDDWYDKNLDPLLNLNTTLSQFGEFVLLRRTTDGAYVRFGQYDDNTYRISDWQVMQSMGAVFFPASGIMMDHSSSFGGPGLYDNKPNYTKITEQNKDEEFMFTAVWSSRTQSAMFSMGLCGLGFAPWSSSAPSIHYAHWQVSRSMAIPVRLVRDADYIEPVYSLEVRDITVEKGGNPVTAQAVVKDAAGNPILAEVTWTDLTSGDVIPSGSTVALSNGGTTVSVTPGALTDAGQLTVSAPASSADGFVGRMRASILVGGIAASCDFNVAVAGFDLSVSPVRSGIWEGETITIDAQAYSGSTPVGKTVAWTIEGNGNGYVTEVSRTATSITLRGVASTMPGAPVTVKASADENTGIQASATLVVRPKVQRGSFHVDTDKSVFFAPGTLQYVFGSGDASLPAGADATGTWRFAEHQYDFVKAADNLSRMKTRRAGEVIDLFHWGATGINYEDGQYYLPWTLDRDAEDSKFGPSSGTLSGDSEWGVHTITNGVPQTGWRTLTPREWTILSSHRYIEGYDYDNPVPGRTGYSALYGFGTVNGIRGYVFLPDDFVQPGGMSPFVPDIIGFASFPEGNNVYSLDEWALMERAGAVFMPGHGSISQMYQRAYEHQDPSYYRGLLFQTTGNVWWGGFTYFRTVTFGEHQNLPDIYRGDKIPVRLVIDAPAGDEGLNVALQQTGFVLSRYTQKTGVTVLYNGTDVTASATVSWSIDNSSVATMTVTPNSAGVAGAGITVTPVAAGNATITCSVTYGGQTKVLTAGVIVSQ